MFDFPNGRVALFIVVLALLDDPAMAGDWPQVLGPHRNGRSIGEKLAGDWSEHKPVLVWSTRVGQGYAGPAVKDHRVFLFHRKKTSEILDCIPVEGGNKHWSANWTASYRGRFDSDHGPRCVPLVHKDRVIVFGASGDLHCVALKNGEKLWSRSLGREHKAEDGYFGFASSPILVGGTLMVNVGGENDASIVAVDPDSGKTLWTTFHDKASYAAPSYWTTRNGQLAAMFVTRFNVVGVHPDDGKILFRFPFGAPGPTVNAATPIDIGDDRIFVTASYGIGAKCVSLTDSAQPEVEWESDDVLSSQYPTPVFRSGHVYGVHGRDDGPLASFRCVDTNTGTTKWSKEGVGMTHLIVADGKLLAITKSGELLLIELSSAKYNELGRIRVSDNAIRAHPALSNGRLYVRDIAGTLMAWQLPE